MTRSVLINALRDYVHDPVYKGTRGDAYRLLSQLVGERDAPSTASGRAALGDGREPPDDLPPGARALGGKG